MGAESQGELVMEGVTVPTGPEREALAREYGTTRRTLDRLLEIGRQVKSMPDLTDPRELERWWLCYKHNKPSKWLRDAVMRMPAREEVPEAVAARPVDFAEVEESGDLGLEMMRKLVKLRSRQLAEAFVSGEESEIAAADRNFARATDNLRKLEQTAKVLEKAGGDLVSKERAESAMAKAVLRLGSVVKRVLGERLPAEDAADAEDEVVRSFKGLAV